MLRLLLILSAVLISQGCSFSLLGGCENFVEKEHISPNGKLKAVIFDRGCGATVGFVTGISILNADEILSNSDTGNVLFADHIYKDTDVSIAKEVIYYEADWVTDDQLSVLFTDSDMLTKNEEVNGIKVAFTKINR